ncbi:MAG: hypothetical protein ACI9A1_001018, partial [Lentimonas sp.]
MRELTELAMTDIGTRSKSGGVWRLGFASAFVVICYV